MKKTIKISLDNNNYEWIVKFAYRKGAKIDTVIEECIEQYRQMLLQEHIGTQSRYKLSA